MGRLSWRALTVGLMALDLACAGGLQRTSIPTASASSNEIRDLIDSSAASTVFLKAHMRDGSLAVFGTAEIDSEDRSVRGEGTLLDVNRDTLTTGSLVIPLDSVALFESNQVVSQPGLAAITLITGISVTLTLYCATNPKACFGSCPTFYLEGGDGRIPRAEGFSSSIAPSLEARDVDDLSATGPEDGPLRLEMRNEALETHVVRSVDVLLANRPSGSRVFRDQEGRFWSSPRQASPASCVAEEGSCTEAVTELDGVQRSSLADSTNLAAKEEIELTFDVPEGSRLGLVVGARQTLLSTYLLYQAMAYMGSEAGAWLARIERGASEIRSTGIVSLMGGIEVLVLGSDGSWKPANDLGEHGPLATDVQMAVLPEDVESPVRIRLTLTKGGWRLDNVALAVLDATVDPVRVSPSSVLRRGVPDEGALDSLLNPDATLVTQPGDNYTLEYDLPDGADSSQVFLEARGYYLEWIREEWIQEEDAAGLARLLLAPAIALRDLAAEYKKVEDELEAAFWGSRYVRP